jgi:hypothetical protein
MPSTNLLARTRASVDAVATLPGKGCAGIGVNRRANGTPDRRRKGTPLRHDDTIKPGARFALVVA